MFLLSRADATVVLFDGGVISPPVFSEYKIETSKTLAEDFLCLRKASAS